MNIGAVGSFGLTQVASNLFSKLDKTQKGYLEESDLQSALGNVSASDSGTSDASAVFSQLDGDGDGKVTESELTSSLQSLVDTLQTQLKQSSMQGMDGMPPPPPPGNGSDSAGFTQDQLTQMASDTASTDSKMSSLFSKLADNFDAADTDGDGKVSHDEAMAFDKSSSTAATDSSKASSTSGSDNAELQVMLQIMKLLQAYGSDATNSSSTSLASTTSSSSSLSVSA
jgi:Ca2+-binding EF-hand superfamily protein